MATIEEKRVYGDREGATDAYVASSMGVLRVRVAGATVGEFSLRERCDARDLTVTDADIAVATDDDVRLLEAGDEMAGSASNAGDTTAVDTGFGPATAVGYDGGGLLAADADGRVARRRAGDGSWESLVPEPIDTVRAIDGDLVGTDSGVYRVHDDELDHAGLTDVRDVAAAGVPLAASVEGLYKLGNGWMTIRDGEFDVVTADFRADPGRLTRAHAVSGATIYEYAGDDEWTVLEGPPVSAPIVDVGYGETVYAVTDDGTFCAATLEDGRRGWRTRTLGITDVRGLAIAPSTEPASD